MTERGTYSRIQVGTTEQDQVIYAGTWSDAPSLEPEADSRTQPTATQTEVEEARDVEAKPKVGAKPQSESEPESAAVSFAARQKQGHADPSLEDLEAEPMSGLQRGVLVAVALFVAAFAVYWFAIRPLGL